VFGIGMVSQSAFAQYVFVDSVHNDGTNLTVLYHADLTECADVYDASLNRLNNQSSYCTSGTRQSLIQPISDFKNVAVGTSVKLCIGIDATICSNMILVRSPEQSIELHSVINNGTDLIVNY